MCRRWRSVSLDLGSEKRVFVLVRGLHPLALAFSLSLASMMTHGLGLLALGLILPSMLEDLGWTYWHGALLAASGAAGYTWGIVLTLSAQRVVPVARLFQLGLMLAVASLIATGAVRSLPQICIARFLTGLGAGIVLITGGALASAIYVYEPERHRKMLAVFDAGTSLGVLAGGALLPLMALSLGPRGWPELWLTLGLLGSASLPFALWASQRIAVVPSVRGSEAWPWPSHFLMLAGYALYAAAMLALMTFLAIHAASQGASTFAIVALWTTLGLAGLLAPAFWEPVLPDLSPARGVAAAIAFTAAGAAVLMVPGPPALVVVAAALLGFGGFVVPSAIARFVRASLPRALHRTALSTFAMVLGFSQCFGPLVAATVAQRTGSLDAAIATIAATLACGGLLAFLQPMPARRQLEAPAEKSS